MKKNNIDQISVVIPVYNVSAYVVKCVESVLQSTLSNIKVIVVDDCGSDDSMLKVRQLQRKDSRIQIIKNEVNRGLAFSRNVGLSHVRSKYVAFLDSDDWVSPDFYEKLYEAIVAEDADIAVGNVLYAYPKKGIYREEWVSHWAFNSGKPLVASVDDKQNIIYACACWNKLYKTKLFVENNIKFPEGLFVEDVPVTFATTAFSQRIVLVKDAVHYYRQREDSIMRSISKSRRIFDVFEIYDVCYDWLDKLPANVRLVYRQVLDNFQIFNLKSWSTSVCEADYLEFLQEMGRRFRGIEHVEDNRFITKKTLEIYRDVLKKSSQKKYDIFLFGLIPIGYVFL